MPLKILIAEDSETNRLLFSMTLKRRGCDVDLVSNGLEAIQAMEKSSYDLIFLDLNMPILNGIETARRIQGQNPRRTPVYAISGFPSPTQESQFSKVGIRRCILKPLDSEKLLAVTNECGLAPPTTTAPQDSSAVVPTRLLKTYAGELKSRTKACARYNDERNWDALFREAHTIRGLAQMLKLPDVADHAQKLEDACACQNLTIVPNELAHMLSACTLAVTAMEKYITSH